MTKSVILLHMARSPFSGRAKGTRFSNPEQTRAFVTAVKKITIAVN